MTAPMVETWADDDGLADVCEAYDFAGAFGTPDEAYTDVDDVVTPLGSDAMASAVAWRERQNAYHGRRGAAAQREEIARRNIVKVPWAGVDGFDDVEYAAFKLRDSEADGRGLGPGASDRLLAYVGRLSDGPVRTWAWYLAYAATVPEVLVRFDEPDPDPDHGEWPAGSRKSPEDVVRRVRRYTRDRRPVNA